MNHFRTCTSLTKSIMKTRHLLFAISILILVNCTSTPSGELEKSTELKVGYDSLLAQKVGADAYGMRKYIIANLIAGPNRDQDSTTAANLQRAHLDNITKLAEDGKLVLAGPYMDDEKIRGIYVFAVETVEEAEALTNTDPAIQAGRLKMELRPWYGSAALMLINEFHTKVSKESI